ncbi:ras-related protein Rab-30-like isoform X2 [Acanthaster planci]|uniref:Ras-related protein Rab-30-like isoform X2 n=1 Tax=Acanthaster planci TaxID=133434 RepID=A0A8B7Y129_ACAPL|nr:ras-related protein Rab-30-like isoform X2 [Acanthaster planci]
MEDYKYLFKVVLIGNAGVGKTCLVRRFTQGLFPPGQGATIGVDFMIKTVEIGGEKVKLQIWDTAGQERFRSITQSYYHSADALVLVFDVTSTESFNALPSWLKEVEQYASPKVISVLVGESRVPKEIKLIWPPIARSAMKKRRRLPTPMTCVCWKHQPKSRTMWTSSSWTLQWS